MELILSTILGFAASNLQGDFLKDSKISKKWKKRIRFLLSISLCVVAGFVSHFAQMYLDGVKLDLRILIGDIGLAFMVSQTYYQTFFKLK